ncbi:MAG: PASTA domain-containing protein [Clostridia bacterium]
MKKSLSVILAVVIFFMVIPVPAHGAEIDFSYLLEADKLKSLGLFIGTDIGYELDRVPNRAEAGVMLVRLLGKESEALGGSYSHPFTDVPEWVDRYVGYLYANDLTKGVGNNLYAPYEPVDARTYLTFILRALDYSDDEGDFTWEGAVEFSQVIGIISARETAGFQGETFTRGHMAAMSYNALNNLMKNSSDTLAGKLVGEEAVDAGLMRAAGFLLEESDESKYFSDLPAGEYAPYLIGLDFETALIRLRKAGIFEVGLSYSINETQPAGTVLRQSYPAYIYAWDGFACTLEISMGPSLLYHEELMLLCAEKGWPEDMIPYIVSSSKYLAKNTVLSIHEIKARLRNNLNEVKALSYEDSASMGYAALYDSASKNMYFNRYVLDEPVVMHELIHALSYTYGDGKVGFPKIGVNTRIITEAFTAYLAERSFTAGAGSLHTFRVGQEQIVFSSNSYYCSESGDRALAILSPLFILAGENTIEKMFFNNINTYSREVLGFNEKYGEGMWDRLWGYADYFITERGFISENDRQTIANVYRLYLDGILECLEIDYEEAKGDRSRLLIFLNKVREIKGTYPLAYNGYREKFADIEGRAARLLAGFGVDIDVAPNGFWIVPDFEGRQANVVYNNLAILAQASSIGYVLVDSGIGEGMTVGIKYKPAGTDPSAEGAAIEPGDVIKLGGIYTIAIPRRPEPVGNYSIMRDLAADFGRYLADYGNLDNYIVRRLLEGEGISVSFEFIYHEYVTPAMQGRIIGQFPQPGSVLIPGETTVIIKMLKENLQ